MRGLLMRLAPFAPDSSGVVSVLYEYQGLLVICDAGGCTGNFCGFDEPRWKSKRCALFSAGLRDMDAILGRDDKLVDKALAAAKLIQPRFLAIIGTPVPCVIATDFQGLGRLAEKKLGLPTLTFATTGTGLYDTGLAKAYEALAKTFAQKACAPKAQRLGVLGASPLDLGQITAKDLSEYLQKAHNAPLEVVAHGLDSGFEAMQNAASCARNLVIAPSGLASAQLLEQRFGTPYSIDYPLSPGLRQMASLAAQHARVLIIHQQVLATSLRCAIRKTSGQNTPNVTVATFFTMLAELCEAGDRHLASEEALLELMRAGDFDCLLADSMLMRAIPPDLQKNLTLLAIPHFALSGTLMPQELC